MDWRYLWAYHRIADRGARRAPEVSAQLAAIAMSSGWQERKPSRGRGTWASSAWATYAAWKTLGIKQPRNFFAPEKNFVKKLRALADSPVAAELRQDFRGVFAQNRDDVAALHALGWSLDDLGYRGIILVGWGVPKEIVWIGCVDDAKTWKGTPEERAIALYFRAQPFPFRPEDDLHDASVAHTWRRCLSIEGWRDEVTKALLAATQFIRQPDGTYVRSSQRYGNATTSTRVDAFLLIQPSENDISSVRTRQLRGDHQPLFIIDDDVLVHAAIHFPWLWLDPDDFPPRLPGIYIKGGRSYRALILLLLFLAALARHQHLPMTLVRASWHMVALSDVEPLLNELLAARAVLPHPKWPDFVLVNITIYDDAWFGHPELRRLLRIASEAMVKYGEPWMRRSPITVWQTADRSYALTVAEHLWATHRDTDAHEHIVFNLLAHGTVSAAEREIRQCAPDHLRLARTVEMAFQWLADRSVDEERIGDVGVIAITYFNETLQPSRIVQRCEERGWHNAASRCACAAGELAGAQDQQHNPPPQKAP